MEALITAFMVRFSLSSYSWLRVVLFTVLWRMASYGILMVDPDEWTYWVMASEWLNGAQLYTDVIDIKPPGIFLVFIFLQKLSFGSMAVARVLGSVLLGTGAWALGELCAKWFGKNALRWVCAVLFTVAFSFSFGLALNTELFFISLVCLGLFLLLSEKRLYFLGSLVLGLAFLIKYTLLGDLFFACWMLIVPLIVSKKWKLAFRQITILALGIGLPILLIFIYFRWSGEWAGLKYALFELPLNYAGAGNWKARIDLLALFHFRFFWLAIPAYLGLNMLYRKHQMIALGVLLWMFLNWMMVVATGKLHDHYWLQLIPPYAAAAAWIYVSLLESKIWLNQVPVYVLLMVFLFQSFGTLKQLWKPDRDLRHSVDELSQLSKSDSKIWYAGLPAVYYGALNQRCLSPYVHGSLMFEQKHIAGFNIALPDEWIRILELVDYVLIPSYKVNDVSHKELIKLVFRSHPRRTELKYKGLLMFSRRDADALQPPPKPDTDP